MTWLFMLSSKINLAVSSIEFCRCKFDEGDIWIRLSSGCCHAAMIPLLYETPFEIRLTIHHANAQEGHEQRRASGTVPNRVWLLVMLRGDIDEDRYARSSQSNSSPFFIPASTTDESSAHSASVISKHHPSPNAFFTASSSNH